MKIVLVEWDDAHFTNSWEDSDNLTSAAPCWTIGVLTDETEKEIKIIGTACIRNMKLQSCSIPKGCIKRIRRLCLY